MIYVGQCAVDYVGYAVRHLFQRVAEHKYSAIGKAHGGNHLLNESHFSSWESVRANSIAYYLKCFTSRNSNLFWISRRSRYVYRGRAKASPQTYHRRPAALFTNVESAGAGRLGANCGNILGIRLFFLLEWMVCEQTVKLEFKVRGDVVRGNVNFMWTAQDFRNPMHMSAWITAFTCTSENQCWK